MAICFYFGLAIGWERTAGKETTEAELSHGLNKDRIRVWSVFNPWLNLLSSSFTPFLYSLSALSRQHTTINRCCQHLI